MYHPRFKSRHYEIGLKYGGLLKKNKIDLFGLMELDDFQTGYGTQSEGILWEYFPDACEEIRGMADGVGVPYDRSLNFDTVWSSVFNISNNKIYRSEGNPSRTGFKEDIRLKWR